jgi:hypothetical protein
VTTKALIGSMPRASVLAAPGEVAAAAARWDELPGATGPVGGGAWVRAWLATYADRYRLAAVVTAFTVGHSVSLALGALGLVEVSPALVEPLIAASIVYVAVEALLRPGTPPRIGLVAAFGLVHGLGFSGALRDLGFAPSELSLPLLGFNLGVEAGQLLVIAPLVLIAPLIRRRPRLRVGLYLAIAALAAIWMVQRVYGA